MTLRTRTLAPVMATILASLAAGCATAPAPPSALASLARTGTVSDRYQAYNVEMVEVTGGRFWAPYGGPKGEMFRMRPPLDLANPKLVNLARALGPSLMRVSGTWANSTYVQAPGESGTAIPAGFKQTLTRDQWQGVVAFSKAVDAPIITSFVASPGARDADGTWNPAQAQRLLDLTREAGGTIFGAELFNEPTIPTHGSFPEGYKAADFTRDYKVFRAWAAKAAPGMLLMGPGGVAEATMMKDSAQTVARGMFSSQTLLEGNEGGFDALTYHYYGGVSPRCGGSPNAAAEKALTAEWLDQTLLDAAFYTALRDKFAPGKQVWLNETAQAACGGSPWAATFLDSFRYLNQLGALAQNGVQVVMHNTLSASDYALIDDRTLEPRPNYWAAVLWRRTMGATVLAPPASPSPDLRVYAHCLPTGRGGVGLVAINTGAASQSLTVGPGATGWTMTGTPLETKEVRINGNAPAMDAAGRLHGLDGVPLKGALSLAGQSLAFVAVPGAGNAACR